LFRLNHHFLPLQKEIKSVKAIQIEERAMADLLAIYHVDDPGEETVAVRQAGLSSWVVHRSSLPDSPIDGASYAMQSGRGVSGGSGGGGGGSRRERK